jgi:CBS-domain-containing membrane protein
MFSIYGPTGREFKGTLEQMRRVRQVHAADRTRAIEPSLRDGHDAALREAIEFGAPLTGDPARRSAIAAYTSSQQPVHQAWHDLPASEVMHAPVLTVRQDLRIDDAWRQLVRQGRGQAPVVGATGVLVGMVTRSALVNFEQWPDASADAQAWAEWRAQAVETVMLTPIPSVSPQADMRRVARALVDSGLAGLPVVDDDGRVVGFVSRTDVLRAALKDAGLNAWS